MVLMRNWPWPLGAFQSHPLFSCVLSDSHISRGPTAISPGAGLALVLGRVILLDVGVGRIQHEVRAGLGAIGNWLGGRAGDRGSAAHTGEGSGIPDVIACGWRAQRTSIYE